MGGDVYSGGHREGDVDWEKRKRRRRRRRRELAKNVCVGVMEGM